MFCSMTPTLIVPVEAPEIPGISAPHEFYWVANDPAPLAGMRLPSDTVPWDALFEQGFRWVACLCSEKPRYNPDPLGRLVTVELCDLVDGEPPEDPEAEEELIRKIADVVILKLKLGEGVVIHCAGGRGRTGTVLGVVLRKLGLSGTEVVDYLNDVNQLRGESGWPEAKWQAEVVLKGTTKTTPPAL